MNYLVQLSLLFVILLMTGCTTYSIKHYRYDTGAIYTPAPSNFYYYEYYPEEYYYYPYKSYHYQQYPYGSYPYGSYPYTSNKYYYHKQPRVFIKIK